MGGEYEIQYVYSRQSLYTIAGCQCDKLVITEALGMFKASYKHVLLTVMERNIKIFVLAPGSCHGSLSKRGEAKFT